MTTVATVAGAMPSTVTPNDADRSSTVSSLSELALAAAAASAPSPTNTAVTAMLPAVTSSVIASSETPCWVASQDLKPSPSKSETSPAAVTPNWSTKPVEEPGGPGGGGDGSGGDGGGGEGFGGGGEGRGGGLEGRGGGEEGSGGGGDGGGEHGGGSAGDGEDGGGSGGGGGGDGGGAPKTTTSTSAAAEMESRVMPMALSSSDTCASSMALSCSFDAADATSPLLPRNIVFAETTRLPPDASVVTTTPSRPPVAFLNQLENASVSRSASVPAILTP